jgi:hypothetical protein
VTNPLNKDAGEVAEQKRHSVTNISLLHVNRPLYTGTVIPYKPSLQSFSFFLSFARQLLCSDERAGLLFEVQSVKTIILPVILYGCESWSLTLREEHRLRVFENWVLRRIFGPKRDEVTG